MATSLIQWHAMAGQVQGVNRPQAKYVDGTNFDHWVVAFAASEKLIFEGKIPQAYSGGAINVVVDWVADAATSGSATWGVKVLGRADGETYDNALSAQTTQADAVLAAGALHQTLIAIASPGLLAGDVLILELQLTSALTGGDALLKSVELQQQ